MTGIEAYNITQIQQEDGRLVWPPYVGLKEPRWRVNGFEDLAPADLDELIKEIWWVVEVLPWKVVGLYGMGSMANRNTDIVSDIDVAIVFPDHETVRDQWSTWVGTHWQWHIDVIGKEFFDRQREASCRLGVKLDVAPWWGNDFYFDLITKTFVGKQPSDQLLIEDKDGNMVPARFIGKSDRTFSKYPKWKRNIEALNLRDPWQQ